jgi:hypothetical protein
MPQTRVLLTEVGVIVNAADNVAVLKVPVADGTSLEGPGGTAIGVAGAIEVGHRVALRAIPAGEHVRQYGQPIGTSLGIAAGDSVSKSNMTDEVPVVRALPDDLSTPPPEYLPPASSA